ncbi:MAG: trypsin-like peptidase domain-containing protein [Lachnospiraceae bacterium]|nr:trypsin-like peptidase domain-containing protein [Lachnospiraceae bacterium]
MADEYMNNFNQNNNSTPSTPSDASANTQMPHVDANTTYHSNQTTPVSQASQTSQSGQTNIDIDEVKRKALAYNARREAERAEAARRAAAPASNYGAPQSQAPASNYGAPQPQAPASSDSAPQPQAAAPTSGANYRAPGSTYSSPTGSAPTANYSAPQASYNNGGTPPTHRGPGAAMPGDPEPNRRRVKKSRKKDAGKSGHRQSPLKMALTIILITAVCAAVAGGVFTGVTYVGSRMLGLTKSSVSDSREAKDEPSGIPGFSDVPEITEEADTDKKALYDSDGFAARRIERTGEAMNVEQIAEYCMPSMVSITTQKVQQSQSFFTGQTESYTAKGAGSGVIIEADNDRILMVTNYHVIDGSSEITVAFVDGETVPAEVIGYDVAEDLALLSVPTESMMAETIDAVRVMSIGDTNECKVGQQVVAIGNALGYGQSVSTGIVSALNRQVVVDGVAHLLIQTDAAINPGNSGGALINMYGELIGINEVKYNSTSVEGMGYAIPTDTVNSFINGILNRTDREKVADEQRGYMGVTCVTVPESYVAQGYPSGAYITEVTAGGPADEAGIQVGDIVSSIESYPVATSNDLVDAISYYPSGQSVQMTVLRLNEAGTAFETSYITVNLSAWTEEAKAQAEASAQARAQENGQASDGNAEAAPSPEDNNGQNDQYFENPFSGWPFSLPFGN